MATDKTMTTETSNKIQEIAHKIARANENNRRQVAGTMENDGTATRWTMTIGKPAKGKKNRYEATLSRATLITSEIEGKKGHALRGAFKAVHFQFEIVNGKAVPLFAPDETPERIARVKGLIWLADEFKTGMHAINNGNYNIRGYNQFRKNPKLIEFSKKYAGKMTEETEFGASDVAAYDDIKKD